MRVIFAILLIFTLSACTTRGQLAYITTTGEHKTACETEYTWAPSVDKYAVEYILSYCAKKAVEKGHKVLDKSLLKLDLTIPNNPKGVAWTFEYAKKLHKQDELSDKELGYIIAFIDLGLNKG